jgi:hypothetical protein
MAKHTPFLRRDHLAVVLRGVADLFVASRSYIVYRQVFQFCQLQPSLHALSLRSNVISSMKILSSGRARSFLTDHTR